MIFFSNITKRKDWQNYETSKSHQWPLTWVDLPSYPRKKKRMIPIPFPRNPAGIPRFMYQTVSGRGTSINLFQSPLQMDYHHRKTVPELKVENSFNIRDQLQELHSLFFVQFVRTNVFLYNSSITT